jgi:hypothetical protein
VPVALNAKPEKAVSLRQIAAALANGRPARFEGLTRLDGYVIDDDNKDIVLFGAHEPGQPELQPADFIVALRSAFKRGVDEKDGADYTKSAAISLDTDPDFFRRLKDFKTTTPEGRRAYAAYCGTQSQKVRVDGMIRHSRVAKILVDADYRMKKVSQGLETIPIKSPFHGDTEMAIRRWRSEINSGMEPTPVSGATTRYWFTQGRFTYGAAKDTDNMVRFGLTQVVLNDEDSVYTPGKGSVVSDRVDPGVRAFTCAWTDRMEETYRADPLWQEMRTMFRYFALTRIMYDHDAFEKAELETEFLLTRYAVPRVTMPDTLPGISRLETAKRRDGRTTWTYARTVCGGVSVGFNKPLEKFADTSGDIQYAGRNVLGSRPTPTAVAWNMTPGKLRDIISAPATPVSKPTPTPDPSPAAEPRKPRGLEELFKSPPAGAPAPEPAPSAPGKPRSLQDLFKT